MPVLLHTLMTLFVSSISVLELTLSLWLASWWFNLIIIPLCSRLLLVLLPFINKRSLRAFHVVKVSKTLVINSQFKLFAMLHDVKHVASDLKGVLERCTELLKFKDQPSILVYFLLPAKVTTHQLYSDKSRVKTHLPNKLRLRPRKPIRMGYKTYFLKRAPMSCLSKFMVLMAAEFSIF